MSRWKPKYGQYYYYVTETNEVEASEWLYDPIDSQYLDSNNCFETRSKAEYAAEKIKEVLTAIHKQEETRSKLTVEVFDREDCPEWAKWAAVDGDGEAFYYGAEPKFEDGRWFISATIRVRKIAGIYDRKDCEHSLIKRPENTMLPDWVKPGAIGYHKNLGYFKVIVVRAGRVNFKNISNSKEGKYSLDTIFYACSEARCIVDAEDLVGKKVRCANDVTRLITRCDPNIGRVDLGDLKGVPIGTLTASKNYQLIGELKFKYQHMEDGEWVD